ncbi:MAG: hypothetical protein LUC41_05770 [Clostridiales bacterium]|nr:hypothetical protein [Clostridiales bacterium]
MQNNTIILGGFETVYMKKLALYLGSRMGEQISVGIADRPSEGENDGTVWIGSEDFLEEVKKSRGDSNCIILSEEELNREDSVCRYQSCERLYQQIIAIYGRFYAVPETMRSQKQKWIVLTGCVTTSELSAFAATCAMILAERSRVLYLNLSGCSGMEKLFLLDKGVDLSDLTEALRRDETVYPEAYVRQMEDINYIMPPANPMILSELTEEDMARLIEAIGRRTDYRYVVTALGSACRGSDRLFQLASRIFLLTEKGHLKDCGNSEWSDFIALSRGTKESGAERIALPKIEADSSGTHLLHGWQEGAIGQLARIYLEGEK